jgi:hypothetical protein
MSTPSRTRSLSTGQSTTEPCKTCPKKPVHSCHLESFEVTAGDVKLRANGKRRLGRPKDTKAVGADVVAHLSNTYDFVIDRTARYRIWYTPHDQDSVSLTNLSIGLQASWHASCFDERAKAGEPVGNRHAQLKILQKAGDGHYRHMGKLNAQWRGDITKVSAKLDETLGPILVAAQPDLSTRSPGQSDLLAVVRLGQALFQDFVAGPRQFSVAAYSCGRGNPPTTRGVQVFNTLVRVYRESKWFVGVYVPPLGAISASRGDMTRVQSKTVRGRQVVTSTRTTTNGDDSRAVTNIRANGGSATTVKIRETSGNRTTNYVGQNIDSYSAAVGGKSPRVRTSSKKVTGRYSQTVEQEASTLRAKLAARASEFEFKIIHNKRDLAETSAEIRKIIAAAKKGHGALRDVFNNLFQPPSVCFGWSVSGSASVLNVSFGVGWSVSNPSSEDQKLLADGRYAPVKRGAAVYLVGDVFQVELEAKFGIEVAAAGTGFGAFVYAKADAAVGVDIQIDMGGVKNEVPITGEINFVVGGEAYVSAFGYAIAEATLTASTGIVLEGGTFLVKPENGFWLKGIIQLKPCVIRARMAGPTGVKEMEPITVWGSRNLFDLTSRH